MEEPRATGPTTPGYGFAPESEGRLLPWAWARERLEQSHNYLLSTAGDAGPHLAPVWGVWLDGAFLFSTGSRSKKARNFAGDARCAVATERAGEAVIVEGEVALMRDAAVPAFLAAYNAKYAWDMTVDTGPFYALTPRTAFGFNEAAGEFQRTATRWLFARERV